MFFLKQARRLSMRKCAGCGAEIKWVKTKAGKRMPVNVELKTIVTEDGEVVRGYESHFATCPKADDFRKRKPRKNGQ
jgi:hypothetical protein